MGVFFNIEAVQIKKISLISKLSFYTICQTKLSSLQLFQLFYRHLLIPCHLFPQTVNQT